VVIRVFPGIYTENVAIPADPAGSQWNTVNDGWIIEADQRGTVRVDGGFSANGHYPGGNPGSGNGRDSMTFDGIDIMVQNGQHGIAMFGGTNRFNMFKNMVIDGRLADSYASGINIDRGYGQSSVDHVTIVNMPQHGLLSTNGSGYYVSNSIFANNVNGVSKFAAFNGFNHSNFFGNGTDCNPNGACGEWDSAAGPFGNINFNGANDPMGADPLFISTDPSSPSYMWLLNSSPSAGTGNSSGLAVAPHPWEDRGPGTYLGVNHNNMGARPTPEPTTLVLLASGSLFLLRRRGV